MTNKTPLDVWLKFDNEDDEVATYEANVFKNPFGFVAEWYHNDVGQVSYKNFDSYEDAAAWLESEGFIDFTS